MPATATGGGGRFKPPSTPVLLFFPEPPKEGGLLNFCKENLPAAVLLALALYAGLSFGFNIPPSWLP